MKDSEYAWRADKAGGMNGGKRIANWPITFSSGRGDAHGFLPLKRSHQRPLLLVRHFSSRHHLNALHPTEPDADACC